MYKGTGGHSRASVGGDRGRLQQRPGQVLVKDRDPSQDCPTEPAEAQQPQCASGYVLIPANETRRNQIQRIAREELENLERWKEQHRPGPIHLTPKKLGGIETEASARQKQQNNLKQSKYQQKFKRDDYRRKMKEEEEAEILKMKAIQREKANRLEAMQKQQKIQKEKEFEEDKHVGNNDFLSRLKSGSSFSGSYQNARVGKESTAWARSHAYQQAKKEEEERHLKQMKEAQHRKSELLKFKQKEEEKERKKSLQREHRRVNNAFLDRLQGKIQSRDQSEPLRNTNTAGSVSWME